MTNHFTMNFVVDEGKRTITVSREFAAPLPFVWDAYTKADILDQWWAPRPWKAKTKKMDFREGGQWLYVMVGPDGEEHWCLAKYSTIQVQKKFVGLDAFTDPEGNMKNDMPQSKWEVNFSQKENLTLVESVIAFEDLAQLEATIQMGFKEGLAKAAEGLDELLASAKG